MSLQSQTKDYAEPQKFIGKSRHVSSYQEIISPMPLRYIER